MRQIQNMQSTPGCRDASTCGFSARKGRRAHGFRNLPHTSDGRFGSAGKNRDRLTRPRFCVSATCGFVAENRVMLRGFRFFPALPENTATPSVPKRKPLLIPPEKQPIKRKNRLSAVSTDQAGRTVAGPLHSRNIKEKPNLSQSFTGKPQRIKAERQCVSKVTCGQKNTRNFVFSQLRCKF